MTQDHDTKTAAPDDAGQDHDGPGLADFLPDTSDGYIAKAGAALENPVGQADPVAVEDALKSVGDVYVTMSLTAPGCPVAGEMPGQVARALAAVDGVGEVSVELVWSPPWTPERMSDDARLALDF